MDELELLLNDCLLYLEYDLPIPCFRYSKMRAVGIDPSVVEEMVDSGMGFEQIIKELRGDY